MTNSVDPDQMPHSVASYLGLHCLQRPIYPNTRVITVRLKTACNTGQDKEELSLILYSFSTETYIVGTHYIQPGYSDWYTNEKIVMEK